jgi:hypothetical protein
VQRQTKFMQPPALKCIVTALRSFLRYAQYRGEVATALAAAVPTAAAWTSHAVAGRCAMNTLREALREYLALRRSLGFKLHDTGLVLSRFVAFMEEHQTLHITTRLALEWVQQAKTVQPAERARRLGYIPVLATAPSPAAH